MFSTVLIVGFLAMLAGLGQADAFAPAYLGPGGAVSSIGAVLAFIAGILVAILGFLWYPIRRLMRKVRKDKEPESTEDGGKS